MQVADKIIAISESTKRDIIKYFNIPGEKIVVTPLGVEDKYIPIKDEKTIMAFKEKYKIDRPFILFVGSLIPRKNLKNIMMAFQGLKQDGYPHKLIIVRKLKMSAF